jgi:hypothetical protein
MPRDTEETVIEWVSGVNQKGEPFIQLVKVYSQSGKRDIVAQFDPWQARDCALNALSAAEAAQTDAVLMKFLKERLGVTDPSQFGPVMIDFRNLRAQFGTSTPADASHWQQVMDDLAISRTGKPFDPTKKQ